MFGNNNNNNKLQKSRYGYKIDEQGKYVENLEHIRGNAATGEQVHSARTFRLDRPMTFEEMKIHWDEMNREAKQWLENNPGQSANFITSQDTGGNEIIQVVPAKDLIFSGSNLVAIYDEKTGKQIVGQENIIKEVRRRRAERDEWIKQGKLENIFDEIHHTDDGWTSKVKFTAYPNQLHPNEVKSETERLIRFATEKRQRQLESSNSQEFSEESEEVPELVEIDSKKSKTEEQESSSLMEIDKSESSELKTSPTRVSDKLLDDNQIAKASRDELTDLVDRLLTELENRKSGKTSTNYQLLSNEQLQQKLAKSQSLLKNGLSTAQTSANNSPKPNNSILPFVGVVGTVAILFGGLVFWKKKKNK